MDVSFGVSEYLESQAPETPRGVRRLKEADGENRGSPLWFGFDKGGRSDIRFRPPTVGDLRAVAGGKSPEEALFARCVEAPGNVSAAMRRRIDAALGAVAPSLDSETEGTCPVCGARVVMGFASRAYVLQE